MIEVKEDMKLFLLDEEDEEDRVRWRLMIGSGQQLQQCLIILSISFW